VAARGLDLPDLGLVIHADLPQNHETLVHRSGRTGRAGKKGLSVLLVPPQARKRANAMFTAAHIKPKWGPPPSAEEIRTRDDERLVNEIALMANGAAEDDLATARLLLATLSPEQLAAVLVRLHRGLRPAPEEIHPENIRTARPKRDGGMKHTPYRAAAKSMKNKPGKDRNAQKRKDFKKRPR
jgi:ATP-dependent RNA helicase DeaD